jgi:hypothetical protein
VGHGVFRYMWNAHANLATRGDGNRAQEALTSGEAIYEVCQLDAVREARVCRRTLGGIRVERPRFWMKLILTANLRSISINCCFSGVC